MSGNERIFKRYSVGQYNFKVYTLIHDKKVPLQVTNISLQGIQLKCTNLFKVDNLTLEFGKNQIKMNLEKMWLDINNDSSTIGAAIKFENYHNFNVWKTLIHSIQRQQDKKRINHAKTFKEDSRRLRRI